MAIRLECEIHVHPEYKLGEPVRIAWTLRNAGPRAVWVLRWNTFLDGMRGDFLTLTHAGKRFPYEGIRVLRRGARRESYERIPAGGSVSGVVDADRAYPIDRAGPITAAFHLRIQDAFEEGDAEAPRHPASRQPIEVRSGEAVLHVRPGGAPLLTLGAEKMARLGLGAAPAAAAATTATPAPASAAPAAATDLGGASGTAAKPKTPLFDGGTNDQHTQVLKAHDSAYQAIVDSIHGLQSWHATDQTRYKVWFGLFGTQNRDTVLSIFQVMQTYMAGVQVTYDFTDPDDECGWDTYAYTHIYPAPHQCPYIFLCSLFFSWLTSEEDQAEVVVHEVCHASARTDDVAYSQPVCAGLALVNPSAAIDNADNYAFFASAYMDESSTGNGVWQDKGSLSDLTNARPAVAVDPSNALLVNAYQGTNAKLYVRTYDIGRNSWKSAASVTNPANQKSCLPKYGPAIAWTAGTFFIVYLDADPASPTAGQLVCISSSDDGATWTAPAPAVTAASPTACSVSLAALNGLLYCVYSDGSKNLQCVSGTPSTGAIAWGQPSPVGYAISNEPGLGVFNGQLYLMFVDAGQPQYGQSLSLVISPDGTNWSAIERFPDYPASTGPALAAWGSTMLMCLHTGAGDDHRIRYATCTWNPQTDQTAWEPSEWITGFSSTNGPALAGYDGNGSLFGFNKGNTSSKLYWFVASGGLLADAALTPLPSPSAFPPAPEAPATSPSQSPTSAARP